MPSKNLAVFSLPSFYWHQGKYTCQRGLLVVDWAQIHNRSLVAAIVCRTPSTALHLREEPQTGRPSLLHWLLPPESTLERIKIRPIGLRLSLSSWSCKAISSFASSQIHQSGSSLTKDGAIWTFQTGDLESSFAWKLTNQGSGAGTLAYINHPLSWWSVLPVFMEDCISQAWSCNTGLVAVWSINMRAA